MERATDDEAFDRFLVARRSALQRISRHTRGESSFEDVCSEAWLMVHAMREKKMPIDLATDTHQSLLIAHLYQHLVRYTELHVRHAVRLDHAPDGDADQVHPLAYLLAAPENSDPVVALAQQQETRDQQACTELSAQTSLAAAYLHLLHQFDHRMAAVAEHLMISLSYCYWRCAHARWPSTS